MKSINYSCIFMLLVLSGSACATDCGEQLRPYPAAHTRFEAGYGGPSAGMPFGANAQENTRNEAGVQATNTYAKKESGNGDAVAAVVVITGLVLLNIWLPDAVAPLLY